MTFDVWQQELLTGPVFSFADPITSQVPRAAAGVYSIWDDTGRCVYIGMSGRGSTEKSLAADQQAGRIRGLAQRLRAHRSGNRSGDQFCVYVADRLVLPTLTDSQVRAIANVELSMDRLVREYVQRNLSYRFAVVPDGATAIELEGALLREGLQGHVPLLNATADDSRGVRYTAASIRETSDIRSTPTMS